MENQLDRLLAAYCSPALAGIKPANLVSCDRALYPDLPETLETYREAFAPRGMRFEIVCSCHARYLLLVYNEAQLSRYMQDAVAANNVHAVAVELHNSFERVVPKDSSLRTIKDALRAQGALGTLLSGSGSAVFGLFDDQSAAAAAAVALKKTWPWVFVARPV